MIPFRVRISAGESNARLFLEHGGAPQLATKDGNRVASRIDSIDSPCGKCCSVCHSERLIIT